MLSLSIDYVESTGSASRYISKSASSTVDTYSDLSRWNFVCHFPMVMQDCKPPIQLCE